MGKALLIIAVGLFAMYMGFKSIAGYEDHAKHLYGGEFVTLTCDGDGKPISGAGWVAQSAQEACAKAASDQRGRAKWWLIGGFAVVAYGYIEYRKVRAAA
jgi:hypothetical protein